LIPTSQIFRLSFLALAAILIRWLLVSKIAPVQAELFVVDRAASGVSLETVNKDIHTIRGIFNMAIEAGGYLGEGQNPFAKIKKRKVCRKLVNYVSVNEYLALENAAPTQVDSAATGR
jgi:site-specific recombinase XerD